MRISDWSSDVCSSDLEGPFFLPTVKKNSASTSSARTGGRAFLWLRGFVRIHSNVQRPPERRQHAFVHRLAERRMREDGADEIILDQFGGLADRYDRKRGGVGKRG